MTISTELRDHSITLSLSLFLGNRKANCGRSTIEQVNLNFSTAMPNKCLLTEYGVVVEWDKVDGWMGCPHVFGQFQEDLWE
jgi:hypothetical protein